MYLFKALSLRPKQIFSSYSETSDDNHLIFGLVPQIMVRTVLTDLTPVHSSYTYMNFLFTAG